MSYTLHIDDHLQSDEQLVILLKNKNYKFIIRFLDTSYRFNFSTEGSGATFERCIDWCARNAGDLEDARQVLQRLFATFYPHLPLSVRESLAYLAEEIGYDPNRTGFNKCKALSKDLLSSGTALSSRIALRARNYVQALKIKRRSALQASLYVQRSTEIAAPTSMMMHRGDEYVLDIRSEPEPFSIGP